ncbi:cytochrome c oxidase assembly protein ctaG-like [Ptychodera flava]|uniref:cytochrome c oxidase assembly protein ctaG-like n=1 Tax=Ptychodera flava TaxID=63121 RepID=UPI00396A97F9
MAAYIRSKVLCATQNIIGNYGIYCATNNLNNIGNSRGFLQQAGQIRMLQRYLSKVNINSCMRTNPCCNSLLYRYSHRTFQGLKQNQYQGRKPCNTLIPVTGIWMQPLQSLHTLTIGRSIRDCQILGSLYKRGHLRFRHAHPRYSARTFQQRNKTVMIYIASIAILIGGLSYAAVPLYSMFCQVTGLGGQATLGHDSDRVESMTKVPDRIITVKFNADTASSMRWNFKPQMTEVKVAPGETALAFYKAKNPTDKAIIGISTYNVIPFDAGQYFNKIQCFCFEEQILNPHEEVDMPVFFYIDPEFAEDPKMQHLDAMTLSYTFFEAKEGLELPQPFTKQNIH